MDKVWRPQNAADVRDAVCDAIADNIRLEMVGNGSRRGFGRPVEADAFLDLSLLSGVVLYQPTELVLTAMAGTPLAEVTALLAGRRQQLAFEPPDFGPLWGGPAAHGTLGGCAMTGYGGPRRLTAGAPRDHCLGIKCVNGFGQAVAAGGRVMKNVTGFDMTKLLMGSLGTLGVVTELTFKVLPAPPQSLTLVLLGLSDEEAVRAMTLALSSPHAVTAAAHLPAEVAADSAIPAIADAGTSATFLRLEGVPQGVRARAAHLTADFAGMAPTIELDRAESSIFWKETGDVSYFARHQDRVIWWLSVPPARAAEIGKIASELGGRRFYDWGGGSIWLELSSAEDGHARRVRAHLRDAVGEDGHATLIRAPKPVRSAVPPFQPLPAPVRRLTERMKRQFDPQGIFNPGRLHSGL
jgi:glycolate dehydrogenase FAD-binding subunit